MSLKEVMSFTWSHVEEGRVNGFHASRVSRYSSRGAYWNLPPTKSFHPRPSPTSSLHVAFWPGKNSIEAETCSKERRLHAPVATILNTATITPQVLFMWHLWIDAIALERIVSKRRRACSKEKTNLACYLVHVMHP